MNVKKLEKLEELLHFDKGKKIIEQKIKRLTAPGENYGSLILSVDITVKSENGDEKIRTVAKMVPPNDFIQEVFNTQVTFRNEIGFYKNMVPTLQNFQREQGVKKVINFFPKYYGGRLNLKDDNNSKVDSDAVLLLENLKAAKFVNFERTEGFDLEASRLILIDLAHLHAVPIALKLQKPEVFEKEIKQYLSTWLLSEEANNDWKVKINMLAQSIDELKPLLERIRTVLDISSLNQIAREPFATVVHNDCWVNNTMVQLDGNKPIKNKLVDFQVCDYGSPAKDVIFFLFSSVQNHTLEKHYNDFIKLYHTTFTSILLELQCDTKQFSFEAFKKELDYEAKNSQFFHTLFMLFPIFAVKGTVKEISELKPEDLGTGEVTDVLKQKFTFVIKEFAKRSWI